MIERCAPVSRRLSRVIGGAWLLVAVSMMCGLSCRVYAQASDQEQITRTIEQYYQATRTEDLSQLLDLYHFEDATQRRRLAEAARTAFQAADTAYRSVEIKALDFSPTGDLCIATVQVVGELIRYDGAERLPVTRDTVLILKHQNGNWKLLKVAPKSDFEQRLLVSQATLELDGIVDRHRSSDSAAGISEPTMPAPTTAGATAGVDSVDHSRLKAGATASQRWSVTPSGVRIQDLTVGSGPEAGPGSRVSMHYTGWLADGTRFDSSRERSQPVSVRIGKKELITGLDQGLLGMRAGGTRMIMVPADLGYGAEGRGAAIPPNSDLKYRIELLSVSK